MQANLVVANTKGTNVTPMIKETVLVNGLIDTALTQFDAAE